LQPLHREPEPLARSSQLSYNWRWSEISEAITCTFEVDVTVEAIPLDASASTTAGEVSVISDDAHHSPNILPATPLPIDKSHTDNEVRPDALYSAASNVSIDATSMAPNVDNWTSSAPRASASTFLADFAKSPPARIDGRLVPPPVLVWLRSRLDTKADCSVSAVLTVNWWQPILMRILPLNSESTVVNYRLRRKLSSSDSQSVSWWRGISAKNPSADQINRVSDSHRLVYLRTTNILTVGELKSSFRQHWLYRSYLILAVFPFATNLWEVLVTRDYVDKFVLCSKACGYVVEENIRPGMPVGHPSDIHNSFESYLRARERLIGRALVARLASSNDDFAFCAAGIYRDLLKIYRCYDVYNTIVTLLLDLDQPPYSPGWSCIIGSREYPTIKAEIEEHCE